MAFQIPIGMADHTQLWILLCRRFQLKDSASRMMQKVIYSLCCTLLQGRTYQSHSLRAALTVFMVTRLELEVVSICFVHTSSIKLDSSAQALAINLAAALGDRPTIDASETCLQSSVRKAKPQVSDNSSCHLCAVVYHSLHRLFFVYSRGVPSISMGCSVQPNLCTDTCLGLHFFLSASMPKKRICNK